MPTLTMCQGLPGSGKTYWALQYPSRGRVNKDDIRAELSKTGWVWSPEAEKDVIAIRNKRIIATLKAGFDCISDDTNFGKHERALKNIAKQCGAVFEKKVFDTPIEECIVNDAKREGKARVGEKVIRDMAAKYLPKQGITFKGITLFTDDKLMPAIICDIDGTLALHNGRNPYNCDTCTEDLVNTPVADILHAFWGRFCQIIYVTGRDEKYRYLTRQWLTMHNLNFGGVPLHMRPFDDTRRDDVVKSELFDAYIRGKYNIKFVLDDRDRVVAFWRSIGLTCLQVNYGDF